MDSFIPDTFTPTDAPSAPGVKGPAPGPGGEVEFQDFSPERRSDTESFAFDNEDQRNFDPGNVQKAREGVREVFQDAMSRLKTQAEEIKEQARREAHEQGYEAGFKAGREAAQGEFTPFLEMLQQLVEDLSHLRQQMFSKVEREMIQIIVGLAKRVIHHELNSREDSVREVIRLAVQSVLNRQQMTLKVHPDDKLHAESFRPELQQLFHEIQNITIEAQPAIQRGGCMIDTNFGTVEARVEDLFDQIDRILQMAPPAPQPQDSGEPPGAQDSSAPAAAPEDGPIPDADPPPGPAASSP